MPRWPERTLLERFWEKVKVGDPDDCWPWLAGTNKQGFGVFWLAPRSPVYAHRLALMLKIGPLEAGIYACHLCSERYQRLDMTYRLCCNDAHLKPGTHEDNMADMVRDGWQPWERGRIPKPLALAMRRAQ